MVEVTLLAVTGMQKCDTITLANQLASRETAEEDLDVCLFSAEKGVFNQTFLFGCERNSDPVWLTPRTSVLCLGIRSSHLLFSPVSSTVAGGVGVGNPPTHPPLKVNKQGETVPLSCKWTMQEANLLCSVLSNPQQPQAALWMAAPL